LTKTMETKAMAQGRRLGQDKGANASEDSYDYLRKKRPEVDVAYWEG
jgi:hypothetical protein